MPAGTHSINWRFTPSKKAVAVLMNESEHCFEIHRRFGYALKTSGREFRRMLFNELCRYMDPAFSDNRPEVRFTMVLDRDRVRVEAG